MYIEKPTPTHPHCEQENPSKVTVSLSSLIRHLALLMSIINGRDNPKQNGNITEDSNKRLKKKKKDLKVIKYKTKQKECNQMVERNISVSTAIRSHTRSTF